MIDLPFTNILFGFLALVAMFGGQVYLVKRLTAFVKEVSGLTGNAVRLLAFGIGVILGVLFLYPWIVMNPGYHFSVYLLTSVLFLIVAGLTASGDYDITNEIDKETKAWMAKVEVKEEIKDA